MADEKALEIYRQRYATFRHLDRLRWQLLQILGVGSIAFIINANGNGSISSLWWALLGWMFIIFGVVMERIRKGLNDNNEVLRDVAIHIGDKGIPVAKPWRQTSYCICRCRPGGNKGIPVSKPWWSRWSTAAVIAWCLIILGAIYLIIAIYIFISTYIYM